MQYTNPYLVLVPIINQTLFGYTDIDEYFKKNDTVSFSNFFASYHKQFLENSFDDKHEWLLMVLFEYFQESTLSQREDIVKIMIDNEVITQNIILMSTLSMASTKKGQPIDFEEGMDNFNTGMIRFIDKGILSPEMGMFFVLHFRNFEDIKLEEFSDYEFDKKEYNDLISQYLKKQTNFKFS